jgi:hypothetical protein
MKRLRCDKGSCPYLIRRDQAHNLIGDPLPGTGSTAMSFCLIVCLIYEVSTR